MRGSGSDDINLSAATIEWIGPNKAKTLTAGSMNATDAHNLSGSNEYKPGQGSAFNVSAIKDGDNSEPVLNTQDDRFTVKMNATAIGGSKLGEGQNVELRLTTQYGAVTLYRANVPQSLSEENAVTV